jgi:hypothetical protein
VEWWKSVDIKLGGRGRDSAAIGLRFATSTFDHAVEPNPERNLA